MQGLNRCWRHVPVAVHFALAVCLIHQSAYAIDEVDVCHAVNLRSKVSVRIRGVAEMTSEGLIIADYTCPIVTLPSLTIPSMVVAPEDSFRSDREGLKRLQANSEPVRMLFQVLLEGTITCNQKARVVISQDGEDALGQGGYGRWGLAKCKLEKARVLAVQPLRSHNQAQGTR